jgi:hypothetical protein
MSTGFNENNPNDRNFKHYSNPNNNFNAARAMIPMHQVQEVQENLRCANWKKGCKFFAKHHWCTCCMMDKAIGSDYFVLEDILKQQDPDFLFSMAPWQLESYETKRPYWLKWCDNYPRGAT